MKLLSLLADLFSHRSSVHIRFVTLISGASLVGMDGEGNRYYKAKPRKGYKRQRRWVVYNGEAEASRVPPEWHGWLHHQTDAVPADGANSFRRAWQKPHRPNLTGTNQAYRPAGHLLQGGQRARSDSDYEAWKPE